MSAKNCSTNFRFMYRFASTVLATGAGGHDEMVAREPAGKGGGLPGVSAAGIIRESAICLNMLRNQHKVNGVFDGVIMRHFEVPGAGGFLLSTRSGVAMELFPEGETGAYFSGARECIERSKEYLARPNERARIAERAHALVSESHTYTNRAAEMVRMMYEIR